MKRTFVLLLSIVLIAGLSMISCQKKDSGSEKGAAETSSYGEKAGDVVEKAADATVEFTEKAADTAVEYGEKAGDVVEEAAETVVEAGEEAGKALEGLGK